MNKKLTLSLNANVIDRAKEYANDCGRSLSSVIEEFLLNELKKVSRKKSPKGKSVTLDNGRVIELTGPIAELAGCLKGLDPNVDYKKEYREYKAKKYFDNIDKSSY